MSHNVGTLDIELKALNFDSIKSDIKKLGEEINNTIAHALKTADNKKLDLKVNDEQLTSTFKKAGNKLEEELKSGIRQAGNTELHVKEKVTVDRPRDAQSRFVGAGATAGVGKGTLANEKGGIGSSLKGGVGKGMLIGGAAVMGAQMLGDGAKQGIEQMLDFAGAASDLNETLSKNSIIFGSNADAIEQWANGAAKHMGMSKTAALTTASGFGDMFSQLGFDQGKAADMSKTMTQMAADLGSFSNIDPTEVSDMLAGAFRGEYDSLQRVIPNISAARVQEEAMNETHKKTAGALTAQEKAAATLAIVMKDGSRAVGDYDRTSTGFANSQRTLTSQIEDMKTTLGKPFATMFAGIFNKLAPIIDSIMPKLMPAFQAVADIFTKIFDSIDPKIFTQLAENFSAVVIQAAPLLTLLGQILTNGGLQMMNVMLSISARSWSMLNDTVQFVIAGVVKGINTIAQMAGVIPGLGGFASSVNDKANQILQGMDNNHAERLKQMNDLKNAQADVAKEGDKATTKQANAVAKVKEKQSLIPKNLKAGVSPKDLSLSQQYAASMQHVGDVTKKAMGDAPVKAIRQSREAAFAAAKASGAQAGRAYAQAFAAEMKPIQDQMRNMAVAGMGGVNIGSMNVHTSSNGNSLIKEATKRAANQNLFGGGGSW